MLLLPLLKCGAAGAAPALPLVDEFPPVAPNRDDDPLLILAAELPFGFPGPGPMEFKFAELPP